MAHYDLTVCPKVASAFSAEVLTRLRLGDPTLMVVCFDKNSYDAAGDVVSLDHWLLERHADGSFTVCGQIRWSNADLGSPGVFVAVLEQLDSKRVTRADLGIPIP